MELFEAIRKRQSYRNGFKGDRVSRQDLQKIVQAGLDAPSGKNCQTTEFVIVDDPEIIGRICVIHASNKAFQQAQAYIVCISDREPQAVYEGYSFQVEDCAAAVENMLLAITALGYASVWIDGWLRCEDRARTIAGMLEIPDSKVIRIMLPIGIPDDVYKRPEKKPFEKRAWFNKYHC